MKSFKRLMAAVLMASVIGISGFAQKNDNDRRPPKEDNKVKEGNKRPPPQNSNRGNNGNNDKHGRPN